MRRSCDTPGAACDGEGQCSSSECFERTRSAVGDSMLGCQRDALSGQPEDTRRGTRFGGLAGHSGPRDLGEATGPYSRDRDRADASKQRPCDGGSATSLDKLVHLGLIEEPLQMTTRIACGTAQLLRWRPGPTGCRRGRRGR